MTEGMKKALALLAGAASLLVAGCHQDMWQQPRAGGDRESDFFPDRQVNRPFVEGTVPVGGLRLDAAYFKGKGPDGKALAQIPARAVRELGGPRAFLDRGEERYKIYCTPCHGVAGEGNGFVSNRGLGYWQKVPASLHTARLLKEPDGHLYDVLTNGKGVMYGYAARIPNINDRWAIVGYVRALQRARQLSGGAVSIEPAPAPGAASAVAAPAPEVIERAQKEIDATVADLTGDVLFDTAKSDLKPAGRSFLDKVAEVLKKESAVRVEVGGHTDSQGNAASNMTLSEARARSVRSYLIGKGVAEGRLIPRGYGSMKPRADNGTTEGRAKNRRIEFTVLGGGK